MSIQLNSRFLAGVGLSSLGMGLSTTSGLALSGKLLAGKAIAAKVAALLSASPIVSKIALSTGGIIGLPITANGVLLFGVAAGLIVIITGIALMILSRRKPTGGVAENQGTTIQQEQGTKIQQELARLLRMKEAEDDEDELGPVGDDVAPQELAGLDGAFVLEDHVEEEDEEAYDAGSGSVGGDVALGVENHREEDDEVYLDKPRVLPNEFTVMRFSFED